MHNHVRLDPLYFGGNLRLIANVAGHGFYDFTDCRLLIETWLGGGGQRISVDLGSPPMKPQTQPAAFKACVSGDQHFSVTPKLTGHSTPSVDPVTTMRSDRLMRTPVCGRKKPPPIPQTLGIRCP